MLRRCAWCGLTLGWSGPLENEAVTHGICLLCSAVVAEDFRSIKAARAAHSQAVEVLVCKRVTPR
jgi:hypothetical protein